MSNILTTGCDNAPDGTTVRVLDIRTCVRFTDRVAHSPTIAQCTFDDLGRPLVDVTFCVLDLETTGTSPADCAITEVGAVKMRGGECLGTFQTLIDPGVGIPPFITVLTGISDAMVVGAPGIDEVLPALLEFIGDAVVVGHNVRFDLSFLAAALERADRPVLTNRSVDTCALARRLVRDEVPDCKLGTLARHLRLDHQPDHRALHDALATGDLLHLLLERAGALGVTGLDDLLVLPTMAGHVHAAKLALTDDLPRSPGVYLFRDRRGDVLYVGKATHLRARVRSYFSSDGRRKVRQLLGETVRIDHRVTTGALEAAVTEIRLIHRHEPRFNRHGTGWRRYVYVKLNPGEHFPRLSVARVVKDDGALYLGPVRSTAFARRVIEAVETVVPLRRCPGRVPVRQPIRRSSPCTAAQLGAIPCPCSGQITAEEYAVLVERAVAGLTIDPSLLLDPLAERIARLAGERRFEEAAEVRDRADALAATVQRQRRHDMLRRSGTLRVQVAGREGAEFASGRLLRTWVGPLPAQAPLPDLEPAAPDEPVPRDEADELTCVAAWFEREAHRIELLHCDGVLDEPLTPVRRFAPRRPTGAGPLSR